jgi:hypothetical protein
MTAILGNYNNGTNDYTPSWAQNQQGLIVYAPSAGYITRIGWWAYRFTNHHGVVWNGSTGAILAQSASTLFAADGLLHRFELDLTSPLYVTAGQTLMIGYWHTPVSGEEDDYRVSAGNNHYTKSVGSSPDSMASGTYVAGWNPAFYAYLTTETAPYKPTTESYGVVTSATPTIRLNVTTPDASALTTVKFVITGTTPSHGPVTITATGGPWASGSWVSYTLASADLGWTPAAGDKLTYHGIASNGGGTTTGDESAEFTINSASPPTITDPGAGPVIAHPAISAGLVGATVAWTFNDAQGEAQSAYQVCLYADSGGAKGALLTGADSGKVSSVGARSATVTPTSGLTNKADFWVGVTTWDVHDLASSEATVKTRMAWGRHEGRHDLGATPTVWTAPVVSTTVPANSTVIAEWTSTAAGTGQTGWMANFGAVALQRWLHWRVWLFGWASATPTSPSLDAIQLQYTSTANVVPDLWTVGASGASLDTSVSKYGTQSLKVPCTGGNTTRVVTQSIPVKAYTAYVISGSILVLKTGGTVSGSIDLYDGANTRVATNALTATTSDFTQVSSAPYTTGAETSLTLRCVVVDGTGSSGSVVWFDAIKAEASTVVTAWSPGFVGRPCIVDAGGLAVDATTGVGGTFRLMASTGTAYDTVELGTHGLKFGGGPEIYSPDGVKLNLPGTELDYVEITAPVNITATTEATANTVMASNSITPDGVASIMVEVYAPYANPTPGTANASITIILVDSVGPTVLGNIGLVNEQAVTGYLDVPIALARRLTPSNAARTYTVKAYVNGGTGNIGAGAGSTGAYVPAFIRITRA